MANVNRQMKFKRVFEKDEEPLNITGSTLNKETDGVATPAKSTCATRAKASNGDDDSSTSTAKTPSSVKKRKVAEAKEGEQDSDDEEAVATPKKKAKAPTNKAPKSPKPPKAPRAPRTPKGAATETLKTETVEVPGAHIDDSIHNEARTGSPEVQAKTDAIVKENEKAVNGEIGDNEKQAIHDGVEKKMAATTDKEEYTNPLAEM